jgi:sulfoxide reductase heme-binding subunit YedZ
MNKVNNHFLYWIKQHYNLIWYCVFFLCCLPILWLLGEWKTGNLGINPLNRLLHFSGTAALVQMLVTLSVTPLRRIAVTLSIYMRQTYGKRLSDWNWMIKLRRQLGLFAFFYAVVHLLIYLEFDVTWDIQAVLVDIQDRPFIMLGFVSFLLLLPLAATSNGFSIRKLGGNWRKLHKLSYLIIVFETMHYWLQMKVGQTSAIPFAICAAILLVYRLWAWTRHDRYAGQEVLERI